VEHVVANYLEHPICYGKNTFYIESLSSEAPFVQGSKASFSFAITECHRLLALSLDSDALEMKKCYQLTGIHKA